MRRLFKSINKNYERGKYNDVKLSDFFPVFISIGLSGRLAIVRFSLLIKLIPGYKN